MSLKWQHEQMCRSGADMSHGFHTAISCYGILEQKSNHLLTGRVYLYSVFYIFLKIILICMYWSLSFFPIISTIKYTYVLNTDKPLFWFYIPIYTPTIQIFTISSNSFKDCCLNALFLRLRISSVILFFLNTFFKQFLVRTLVFKNSLFNN